MEVFPDDKNRPQDGDQRQTMICSFEHNDVSLIWASRAPFTRKAPCLITQAGPVSQQSQVGRFALCHNVDDIDPVLPVTDADGRLLVDECVCRASEILWDGGIPSPASPTKGQSDRSDGACALRRGVGFRRK